MTAIDPGYDVHSIDFLDCPAAVGLTQDFAGAGVIQASQEGTGQRYTFLVEHEYAVLSLSTRRDLEGFIPLAITAIRWARLGWPEDWPAGLLNPTWAAVYPAGWSDA